MSQATVAPCYLRLLVLSKKKKQEFINCISGWLIIFKSLCLLDIFTTEVYKPSAFSKFAFVIVSGVLCILCRHMLLVNGCAAKLFAGYGLAVSLGCTYNLKLRLLFL